MQSIKSQVKLCALLLGLLLVASAERGLARVLRLDEQLQQLASNYQRIAEQQAPRDVLAAAEAAARQEAISSAASSSGNDEDEDEDDISTLTAASLPSQHELARAANRLYAEQRQQPSGAEPSNGPHQQVALGADLNAAASKHYHHHKHGAKGWLDMGAWTGKKGAFGWYDKHPVGKGK